MSEGPATTIVDTGAGASGAGTRIGPWELVRPLESGGMGVVWLGRRADDAYEQAVAIKLIRPSHLVGDGTQGRQLVARFEAERQILARMTHPNVARILDGGTTTGGQPFLVMEFVDGVSLTDFARRESLDVPARVALFAKVCDGVQDAHRHLVVHRDLKPDNILVGADGEPRLLDFGIAKILEDAPGGENPGTALSAMTPAYASPEQVRQEALSTSSDVYSLGVVLYQLLAGVRPYELGGLRPAEAEHVVCDLRPEPMRKMLERAALPEAERHRRRVAITPDLERIVEKAMHKEPARRYGSAQALADDLRRWLAGEPVQAMPDSFAYRVRRFVGRHRAGTAIAATALLAVCFAAGIAVVQAQRAQRAAADTTQVNAFLTDVLEASDPFESGGELTLAQAVDAAAGRIDERFAGRPDLAAGVRHVLGYSLASRGRVDRAEPLLLQARADAATAFGADDLRTLEVDEAIALLRLEQGRVDEAEAGWRKVIATLETSGRRSAPLYRVAVNNLGMSRLRQEDYAGAQPWFELAATLPAADPASRDARLAAANVQANLGQVAHGLGDLDAADARYRQAQQALEGVYPDGHPDTAIVLNNRSLLAIDRGDRDAAHALLAESVAIRERSFPDEHPLLVGPLAGLAQLSLQLDRTEQGLALARRADAMARRVFARPDRNAVFAAAIHAAALLNLGRHVEADAVLAHAETGLAALPERPADLEATLPALAQALCRRPRDPPLPRCDGIEPTEPAFVPES